MIKLDVLAFGAHPDDVELGAGATMAKLKAAGKRTGIVDLTEGELGTRGTSETRKAEAAEAAEILGLSARVNLGLADGFFEDSAENRIKVIEQIRYFQPDVLLINAPSDRHPDHGRASGLLQTAQFLSGLRRIATVFNGEEQAPWRPRLVLKYIQFLPLEPQVIVDVTGFIDLKVKSCLAYKTQFFNPNSQEPSTAISSANFLESITYRSRDWGRIIGTEAGEAFLMERTPGVSDVFDLI
jgi:bacillithiol biosynthesis deacetylase BshB1